MPSRLTGTQRGTRFSMAGSGNRYRQQRKSVSLPWNKLGRYLRIGVYVFLGASFFLVCSLGLLASYRWMTQSDYFALRHVDVSGINYIKYDEVLRTADLSTASNTLALRMKDVEQALHELPWVESVALKRELPDTLRIDVRERIPYFWVQKGEQLFFADRDGEVIAPVSRDTFKALPLLYCEDGAMEMMDVFRKFSTRARALHAAFDPAQAAWVRFKKDHTLELYIESRDLCVSLDARHWELNLDYLRRVWTDLVQRGEHEQVRAMSAHGAKVWVTKGPKIRG